MHIAKALMLSLLLIISMIGFDNPYAAGDLTRRGTALSDLRLGSEESDLQYSLLQIPLLRQGLEGKGMLGHFVVK